MSNIIPFQFESNSILVAANSAGDPMFVAKNIADALGYSETAKALAHCKHSTNSGELNKINDLPPATKWIPESDVYRLIMRSNMPNAEPFQDWVTETVIPSIRKTGGYSLPSKAPTAISASKEFRALYGIARLIGCDKNVAAISANQAVQKLTGQNVLALLGHTHIEAENQASLFFTPTELGARIGISARKFNMLLAEAGMQAKKGEHWVPLVAAEGFCRILDTGKRHGDGTMIQQVKWVDNVLALVEKVGENNGTMQNL